MISFINKGLLALALLTLLTISACLDKEPDPKNIFDAVIDRDYELAESILDLNPEAVNQVVTSSGHTPIYYAAANADLKMIDLLLSRGAELKGDFQTPVHGAASSGDLEVILYLHEKGADLEDEYWSPYFTSVEKKNIDLCELCIELGLDPDKKDNRGKTALHEAASLRKNQAMIDCLLRGGADLEARDNGGSTPLFYACAVKDAFIARRLILAGANVNVVNDMGDTPLHVAAGSGQRNTLIFLLVSGADPNAVNNQGCTPLNEALMRGRKPEISELLLKHGAKPDAFALVMLQRKEELKRMLDDNPGLSNAELNDRPIMYFAIVSRNEDIINLLFDHGADPNYTFSKNGEGLVHVSMRHYSPRPLIERGAPIDKKDYKGRTPLHFAARNGYLYGVKTLLECGADVNARDIYGRTPLYYSMDNNTSWASSGEIAVLLKKHGGTE